MEIREIPKGYSYEPPTEQLASYWAFYGPMRQFVIKNKLILRRAIESAKTLKDVAGELISFAKKIPEIRKGNSSFINSHILSEKTDTILAYHQNHSERHKMLETTFRIGKFTYETDGFYAFIIDMLLIELAMELAKGNWVPRFSKFPIKHCWDGPDLPDIETIRKNIKEALKDV